MENNGNKTPYHLEWMKLTANFEPKIHLRHSIRLTGYDYSQAGAYFVTIVTNQRHPFFGEVVNGTMKVSELGQIAQKEWFRTAELRSNYGKMNSLSCPIMCMELFRSKITSPKQTSVRWHW